MKPRIVFLVMSLGTIALALLALNFVTKIVAIGGPSYRWEYGPPMVLLILGMGLSVYWLLRILHTGKKDQGNP